MARRLGPRPGPRSRPGGRAGAKARARANPGPSPCPTPRLDAGPAPNPGLKPSPPLGLGLGRGSPSGSDQGAGSGLRKYRKPSRRGCFPLGPLRLRDFARPAATRAECSSGLSLGPIIQGPWMETMLRYGLANRCFRLGKQTPARPAKTHFPAQLSLKPTNNNPVGNTRDAACAPTSLLLCSRTFQASVPRSTP